MGADMDWTGYKLIDEPGSVDVTDWSGYKEIKPPAPRGVGGFIKDTGLDLAKGVVSLGESAVGIADLATGGYAGKGLAALGYDPKQTNAFLSGLQSDARQQSDREVAQADGFWDTLKSLGTHPDALFGNIVQSLPGSIGAGAAGGMLVKKIAGVAATEAGVLGLTGKAAEEFIASKVTAQTFKIASVAGAAEGAQTAGSIAEQGRQGGRDWDEYVVPALAAGLGTAAIGMVSGKIASKLGIGDLETDIAARSAGVKGAGIGGGNIATRTGKEMLKEGILEEMPQSYQEQAFQNLAMGKPWEEGTGSAAAQGLLAGAGMAGGHAVLSGRNEQKPQDTTKPDPAILGAKTVDEAITAFTTPTNFTATPRGLIGSVTNATAGPGFDARSVAGDYIDGKDLADLVQTEQRDLQVMRANIERDRAKQAELDQIPQIAAEQNQTQDVVKQAATLEGPSALALALQEARQRQAPTAPEPAASTEAVSVSEPRIVERTADMTPMPKELAELQVDMDGGEVVRIQNRNGKFAYTVIKDSNGRSNAVSPTPAATLQPASDNPAASVEPGHEPAVRGVSADEVRPAADVLVPTSVLPEQSPTDALTKPVEESVQEKSHREWGENYNQVINAPDLTKVDTKSLDRAIGYGENYLGQLKRQGWDGSPVNQTLIDQIQIDVDAINAEAKARRKAVEQGTPASSTQPIGVTSSEPLTTTPVAESQALPPEGSDASVAPGRDGVEPIFDYTQNKAGNVTVKGDPAEIRTAFTGLKGATVFADGKPAGVMFGVTDSPAVLERLKTNLQLTENQNGPQAEKAVTENAGREKETAALTLPFGTQPVLTENAGDSTSSSSELLRNAANTMSTEKKGFDSLDANTVVLMKSLMGSVGQDQKVLKSVIELIPVDVVNMLARKQLTPEMLFHDPSMLQNRSVGGDRDNPITIPIDAATSIVRVMARAAAKNPSLFEFGHSGGLPVDNSPANNTGVAGSGALPVRGIDLGGARLATENSASVGNSRLGSVDGTTASDTGIHSSTGRPTSQLSEAVFDRATAAAKDVGGSENLGRIASDGSSALSTIDGKHVVTPSSNDVPGAGSASTQPAPPTVSKNSDGVQQGEQVSQLNGKYGKGMNREPAKMEAMRLNNKNTDKSITYTAEEHGDAKLENPYAVIGRKANVPSVQVAPSTGEASQQPAEPRVNGNLTTTPEQQRAAYMAEKKRREAAGNRARSQSHERNPFKAWIAKHGITSAVVSEFAPGLRERRSAMVPGYGPIFKTSGKQLDALAQLAVEDGYLTIPDVAKLSSMIHDVLSGKRHFAQYAEGIAEDEMNIRITRQNQFDAEQELSKVSDEALYALDENTIVPWTDEIDSSIEDYLLRLNATEQEIQDAVAQESEGQAASDQGGTGAQETDAGSAQGSDTQGNAEARTPAQDLLGDVPNASQQAAADILAAREKKQKDALANAPAFEGLDMVDSRNGNVVAPGQQEIGQEPPADPISAAVTALQGAVNDLAKAIAPKEVIDKVNDNVVNSEAFPGTDWKGRAWDGKRFISDEARDSEMRPDYIGSTKNNAPYENRAGALGRLRADDYKLADTHEIVQVGKDGYAVRPKESAYPDYAKTPGAQPAQPAEQESADYLPKGWKKDGSFYEFRSASGSEFTPTQIAGVVGGTVTKQGMHSLIGVPYHAWETAKRKLKEAGMWGAQPAQPAGKVSEPQKPYGDKSPSVKVTTINTSDITGVEHPIRNKELRRIADAVLRDIRAEIAAGGNPLTNEETGWSFSIASRDLSKMGNNPHMKPESSKAAVNAREIVNAAVLAETHSDTHGHGADVVHRFYAPAMIDGNLYRVRLTVLDFNETRGRRNLHAILAVEIENAPLGTLQPADASKETATAAQPTTGRTVSIADLLLGVKREDGKPLMGNYTVNEPSPIWRSALADGIDSMNVKAQHQEGWRAQIQGMVNKGAVKADEVEWSGLTDWLKLQQGKVTKEQVSNYLAQNGVQITETVLGELSPEETGETAKRAELASMSDEELADEAESAGVSPDNERRLVIDDIISQYLNDGAENDMPSAPKYATYQLPGGENYREVLLTLPVVKQESEAFQKAKERLQRALDEEKEAGSDVVNRGDLSDETDLAQRIVDRHRQAYEEQPQGYKSAHWDQPNVLAHIRVNDRTDASGAKVLFVEEIQSDWGQAGKKKGIDTGGQNMPEFLARATYESAGEGSKNWRWKLPDGTGGIQPSRAAAEQAAADSLNNRQRTGVPNAPFVGKTDAWVALALKRVIKLAVDGGYDKVAFVNGEQSADRYDLSKSVTQIAWQKNPDGTFTIEADTQRGEPIVQRDKTPQELEEIIGKEATQKIVDGVGRFEEQLTSRERGRLSNLDLKVGGEGMKSFYDKIVPTVTKNVLRKLGGGKMEVMKLSSRLNDGARPESIVRADTKQEAYKLLLADGKFRGIFESREEANDELVRQQKEYDAAGQTSFTITDAMKEHASKGMPLFEPQQAYNNFRGQLDLFLNSQPDPSQAGARLDGIGKGIEAAKRDAVVAVEDLHATGSVLARTLSSDLAAKQRTNLVGQTVANHHDLAVLAQLYRDERFETFRVIFTDKNDKVVSQVGVTSRLPGSVEVVIGPDVGKYISDITATAKQAGATSYSLLHNHPSGKATPSSNDEFLTKNFDRQFAMQGLAFKGHVVIDTNEYAVISSRGDSTIHKKDFGAVAPTLHPQFGGFKIAKPDDIMQLARLTGADTDGVTLIVTDHQYRTKAVTTLPSSAITSNKSTTRLNLLKVVMRSKGSMVFAVSRNEPLLRHLSGMVVDGVYVAKDGSMKSLATLGVISSKGAFPESRRTRVSADTSAEFNYLREASQRVNPYGAAKVSEPSRSVITGQTDRQYTPEQLKALSNIGQQVQVPTLKERFESLTKDLGKRMIQGTFDQFMPLKELGKVPYMLARLSKGASGAFDTLLHGGKLKLSDGVYDFDEQNKGGVLDKLLLPLQGEHHDFLRWVAANRAESLMGEGRENLFTPDDIKALKALSDGTTNFDYKLPNGTTTRDRTLIYADALKTFNGFQKNVMDMYEQSGGVDPEVRKAFEREFYLPFYRVEDGDGGIRGGSVKNGLVRQDAIKKLKGGKDKLNFDLLDNTLMNWASLLDAAAKNRAAKSALDTMASMGKAIEAKEEDARQMAKSIGNKEGVVWYMENGKKRFFVVDDPYLLTAVTSLEYAGMSGPIMKTMSMFKHALTVGVTASPFFKVRNLIRDSVQVIASGPISYNPAKNIAQGWKLTDPKSDAYFKLLAGGGTIHFSTMYEGSEARRVQALVDADVDQSTILNTDQKLKAFYRKGEKLLAAYNELGNRGEAVNRAALYDQLVKNGMSHAEASLQARDLMDFSMQGSFTAVRFFTQVVPFLNARLEGIYKLGRAAKEDPQRFATVLGATAVFSLALLAAYHDDDDWKKRTEGDRNNYWWFKFGGVAYRIPKPFEVGAVATVAERMAEYIFDKEMTGKRFREQIMQITKDQLAMNPVPQMVKPILDIYANKDSFSGIPIESMSMERLKPEYRFNDRTTMTARGISTAGNTLLNPAGINFLSPVQVDHLVRGYFAWLGTFVVSSADTILRTATNQPAQASGDMLKLATGGLVTDLRDAPSRYVSNLYNQAREIEQAMGTYRALQKEGKGKEAAEFLADNRADLQKYKRIEHVKQAEAKFNEKIRMIERSAMTADKKREQIRAINIQKDRVARSVMQP